MNESPYSRLVHSHRARVRKLRSFSTYACAVSDLFFRSTAAGERNMAASLICGRLSAGLRNSGSRTALSSTAKVGFGEEISSGYI